MPVAQKTDAPLPRATPVPDDAERAARCALCALPGVGAKAVELLLGRFESLSAAAAAGGEAASRVVGMRSDAAESLRQAGDLQEKGQALLARARALGCRVIVPEDEDWPASLRKMKSQPQILYVLGSLTDAARPGTEKRAAIVGSRHPDDYGRRRARALATRLCAAGVEVVSGAAEGIDTEAHAAALAAGGRTLAVIGTGIAQPYPAGYGKLYERIACRGAVLGEFAPDEGGQRHHFPRRNRVIAGLSQAVVLVRGDAKSGALSTCEAASELSRPVFAVPGEAGDLLSDAPLALLSAGTARAAVTGDEVLEALKVMPPRPAPPAPPVAPAVPPGPHARRLLDAMRAEPRHVDELAAEAGLTPAQALAELLVLELSGQCIARPGKYFSRRHAPGDARE